MSWPKKRALGLLLQKNQEEIIFTNPVAHQDIPSDAFHGRTLRIYLMP